MAIDLDKSHYDENGEKIEVIREVRPEKDVPEIYPQREIYPQKEIYPQEKREIPAPAEEPYPQMRVGEQTGMDNYRPQLNMPARQDKNPALKIAVVCAGATFLVGFIVLSTVLSGLLGAVKSGITGGSEYTAVTEPSSKIDNYNSFVFPAADIGKIYIDVPYTYVTVMTDDYDYESKIQLRFNCEEEYGIRASEENGILNITSDLPKGTQGEFTYERYLSVFLPYNCEADISLGCDGGRVSCSGLNVGSVEINNAQSDISVLNSTFRNLQVKTLGDNCTLSVNNVASERINISANNNGCYMNMVAGHDAEVTCQKYLNFSDAYFDRSTVLLANSAYIMNTVLSGESDIASTADLNIVNSDIKGSLKAESLTGGVSVTNCRICDTLFIASSPAENKAYVRARLGGDGSSYLITENNSEEFVSEIEKQVQKSGTDGKYAIYARTRGGNININFDGDEPDTEKTLNFAERYGYYSR